MADAPTGLRDEAITWLLSPTGTRKKTKTKKKHSFFFQRYKLFTLYYPAKLGKYTVAACWGVLTTEKGYIETFKENRQTDQNTGFNLNTIVPNLSEH